MLLKFNSNELLNHFVDEDSDEEGIYSLNPRVAPDPSFYKVCTSPKHLLTSSDTLPPIPYDYTNIGSCTAPDGMQIEVVFIETFDSIVSYEGVNLPLNSFVYYQDSRSNAFYSFFISKTVLIPGVRLYYRNIDWTCGVQTPSTICLTSSVVIAIDPVTEVLSKAETGYPLPEPYDVSSPESFYRNIEYTHSIRRMYPRGICPECFQILPTAPHLNDPPYFEGLPLPPDSPKTLLEICYLTFTTASDTNLLILIFMKGGCKKISLSCTAFYRNIINYRFVDVEYVLVVSPKDEYVDLSWCTSDPGVCGLPTIQFDACYNKITDIVSAAYTIERNIYTFFRSFFFNGPSYYSKLDTITAYSGSQPITFYLREDVVPYKTEFYSEFGENLQSLVSVFLLFESAGYAQELNATLTVSRYKYTNTFTEDTLEHLPFPLSFYSNYRNADSKVLLCWYCPDHIISSNVTKVSVTIAENVVGHFTFFYSSIPNTCTKEYTGLPVCSGECISRVPDWDIGGDALKVGQLDSIHKTKDFESSVQFGNKYNV